MATAPKYLPNSASLEQAEILLDAVESTLRELNLWRRQVELGKRAPIERYDECMERPIRVGWQRKMCQFDNARKNLSRLVEEIKGQSLRETAAVRTYLRRPEIEAATIIYDLCHPGKLSSNDLRSISDETLLSILAEIVADVHQFPWAPHQWKSELRAINSRAYEKFRQYSMPTPGPSLDFGIYTALELEFQAVLRRLDEIHLITDDSLPGHQLRHMCDDIPDLQDALDPVLRMGLGVALGRIGKATVLVACCSGFTNDTPREESVKTAMRKLETDFRLLADQWLCVGVCGGGSRGRPLGSVLVSQGAVHILNRLRSTRYRPAHEHSQPLVKRELLQDCASLGPVHADYQEVAALLKETDYQLAAPDAVPIGYVPFASVGHLVHTDADRAALLEVMKKFTLATDDFGFEMEYRGIANFGPPGKERGYPDTLIIKGVVDYGGTADKGSWNAGLKYKVQTYASDLAAEAAVRLIRHNAILPVK